MCNFQNQPIHANLLGWQINLFGFYISFQFTKWNKLIYQSNNLNQFNNDMDYHLTYTIRILKPRS